MRAAIYIRVSTTKQVNDGMSLETQEDRLRAFVKSKGWTVHRPYIDAGKSGGSTDRPAFQKMMNAVKRKAFGAIVVYKLDRFSRSLKDLLLSLEELNKSDVTFVSITDNIDLSTSSGKLMFNIIGSFAEFERELIRERTTAGQAEARKRGHHMGRLRLGYKMEHGFMVKEK